MSKIGKKLIKLPDGVQFTLGGDRVLTVKGPKGTLTREVPEFISVTAEDGSVKVALSGRAHPSHWGLWRALVNNMITGVSEGFTKTLEFQGVGYKAAVKGNDLELNLGYSHPLTVSAPEGVSFEVDKTTITVKGSDKEAVGHVAALIRSKRLPEPYKGSGIRYSDEVIRRKAGKKAATA
ncbi:MAG TPA: 50S ribosomal protein L6 [Candidatus Paceibacterota bacterium]|nr:50S ribosomal protein L6 [Candidatus Paceibacterota bacterium]